MAREVIRWATDRPRPRRPRRCHRARGPWRRTRGSSSPRRTRARRASSSISLKSGSLKDALRIAAMEATPQAVWFVDGTPADVRSAVRKTMREAKAQRRVPILVAYNVPFRDCAQYSAGGAHRHRRVQGLDRRLRGGHRRRSGRRDPGAGLARHHPLQHDDLRRRRLVQADGHGRERQRDRRARRQPRRALRAAQLRGRRDRGARPRARWSTSTGRTARGWAWERRRIGWSRRASSARRGSS